MRRVREHQLELPRLNELEQRANTLQSNLFETDAKAQAIGAEVAEARGADFATLTERLDYIMENAHGGGGGWGVPGGLLWTREQIVAAEGQVLFSLANTYQMGAQAIQVYKNGILQTEGAENDYVEVSSASVRVTVPATTSDVYLFLVPSPQFRLSWWRRQIIAAVGDPLLIEVGREFIPGQLQVYRNGVLQRLGSEFDYVEAGRTAVQLAHPFEAGEVVQFILPEMDLTQYYLTRDLAKVHFKTDIHHLAYERNGSQAIDLLTDIEALDPSLTGQYLYNTLDQRIEAEQDVVLTSIAIDAGESGIKEALLYWQGEAITGAISRDNGVTYISGAMKQMISLADSPGGTQIRVKFTLAAGARLSAWGVVWR